ncbi:DUF3530 family protein [Motilimonas pumila]|uniref:DUF3530 family protein n=1 Tax=Motilimonas pumila TaxID=2303987 RepID=A0A418YAD2_9GAMM|nr:DUF3530 family protein [Motilimonas pumila]RJG39478.1 DUF3530 family protein [Motilimonas pumila]
MLTRLIKHPIWVILLIASASLSVQGAPEATTESNDDKSAESTTQADTDTKTDNKAAQKEQGIEPSDKNSQLTPSPTPDIVPANRYFNQQNLADFALDHGNNRIENLGNEDDPLFALIQPAENAPILGTGILLPNLNSTVSSAQLKRFRLQLQAQGWHVITLSPPQLNLSWLAADKALAETYQATFSERLSALKEIPEMAQDNLWVMAQGNSAGYVIQTLLSQNEPAIDALVLFDAAAWDKETQKTLAVSVGQISQPLLDIVFKDANNNAVHQYKQRALQAKLAGKANYRQIILPSQYLERHLEDEVYGWTRFLGWQP